MGALDDLNFRDLGGMAVAGGRLRHGRLYRSEGPASFDTGHHAALGALGLRTVCDLRSTPERERHPNVWAAGIALLNIDIAADLRDGNNDGWRVLRADPTPAGARAAMLGNYRVMPSALLGHVGRFVDTVLAGEVPMLIHCTAGKDRTGALVGLVLRVLGASEADIVADYMLSERFGRNPARVASATETYSRSWGVALEPAVVMPIVGVDAAYLAAMFDAVAEGWGTVERYFDAAGVGDGKLAALAEALVEPRFPSLSGRG